MPLAAAQSFISAWAMSFSSAQYLLFLPLAAAVYFLLRGAARRLWLLLASYAFYFFAAPGYLPVLLCATLLSYCGAMCVSSRKAPRARRATAAAFIILHILLLCFFKYNGFFAALLAPLWGLAGAAYPFGYFSSALALGISFYTFAAIGYIADCARGDVPAERSLLNHALFLGFFPTLTMGPIPRAGRLLPALREDTRRFSPGDAAAGLRRMAVGYFKKLAVADTLAVFTSAVYGGLEGYGGLTLSLAAVCFAAQLYFDFSGYSDIAIGTARVFGVRLPENFQNPYFSTNFSSFWARWHISLSSWLQDYIFTPLVWSRWTEKLPLAGKPAKYPPVLSSIAAVFLVSGLWHGDTLCFAVWGALMAAFRIGEELLHKLAGKPKKNPKLPLRIAKTAAVLLLWTEALVFFKVGMTPGGTAGGAARALLRQFSGVSLSRTAADVYAAVSAGFFAKPFMVAAFVAFTALCLAAALWADRAERFTPGGRIDERIARLGGARRLAVYYLLVLCCFAAFLAQSGGLGGGGFIYGGF